MSNAPISVLRNASPYSAAITREQFLFYETRTTAKLLMERLKKEDVADRVVRENLFQYPTEKALEDESLVSAIANEPSDIAKQICLYAMMREYRLVWDFMLTVVGEKYRKLDSSFGRADLNIFFMRLAEQDDWVATWSDSTVTKIRQILTKILVENEYLDDIKAERLNPVLINPILENAIRAAGQEIALPAFNCLT